MGETYFFLGVFLEGISTLTGEKICPPVRVSGTQS